MEILVTMRIDFGTCDIVKNQAVDRIFVWAMRKLSKVPI